MSKNVTIGIDLGTSNSCVATVADGHPQVLANAYGEPTTASVVSFGEDGSISVGNEAKARVILDPKHTVSSAKRLMGRFYFSEEVKKARAICRYEIASGENNAVRIKIRNEEFSLPEISAFVLKEMKAVAEQGLGTEVVQAVITVPAYFNDSQRQATKDAGRIAGLEVLRILNEPTAAALAYGYGKNLKQKVAVYDLGGGTFDVSVLELGDDVFEVLATCGDTYLGGEDFDDRLIDTLADSFQAEHDINVRSDPFALEKLKGAAERAKIELSEAENVDIEIPALMTKDGKALNLSYSLSSDEYGKLTQDLLQRTFKVCDEALQQSGLSVGDLDGVILVGGPTRLPAIRAAVKEYFQREPEADINPDQVVAMGAAIHADSLSSTNANTYLLDVTPLTLRLGIAGGMTEPIIDRNSPVPIDHTRIFNTLQDHQESIAVRIHQGESRAAEDNSLLGEFEFRGFEPGPRGDVKIEVTFAINTEGIVKVSARDPKTGAEQSTTVNMSSGLSAEEIDSIIARGRTDDVAATGGSSGPQSPLPPMNGLPNDEIMLDSDDDIIGVEDDVLHDIPKIQEDLTEPDELELTTEADSSEELFGKLENATFDSSEIDLGANAIDEPLSDEFSDELELDDSVLDDLLADESDSDAS